MPALETSTTTPSGLTLLSPDRARLQIPHDQLRLFAQETDEARKFVLDWIAILQPLTTKTGVTKLFAAVARQMGAKPGNVKKAYYAYLDGLAGKCFPCWEKLIDRRKFPKPGDRALDARFVDHWRRIREEQNRLNDGGRQAHRDLLAQLDLWTRDSLNPEHRIPGYTEPPACTTWCQDAQRQVPHGWSYRNLMRYQPTRLQIITKIVGPAAAQAFLPSNLGTRVGVPYRGIIFSDDQLYDNRVVSYANRGEPMRPMGFNTLDYLTACFQTYGAQLTRRDQDDYSKKGIDQEFYVWTILADLMRHGYRDDDAGTVIIREHGTAKGYNHHDHDGRSFDEILHHITAGRVICDASGRFDQGMFAQMFFRGNARLTTADGAGNGPKGKAKQGMGNFRYKAPLESAFHRLRTQSAGLLGHTGNRYDIAPEDTAAIDGYTRRLFKALDKLPPTKRDTVWTLLRHHVHTWDEWSRLTGLIYTAVNARRDHKIEGWGKCDFIVPGYVTQNPFDPTSEPIQYSRAMVEAMEPQQRHYIESFGKPTNYVLSPAEAAQICADRDRRILRRLSWSAIFHALPIKWVYPRRQGKDTGGVKVQPNGTLIIRDPLRFGEDALVYLGTLHTEDGDRIPLRPGDQYLLHICPFDPESALVTSLEGRFRGTVKLMPRITATDRAARLAAQGQINQYHADAVRDLHRRHESEIDRREAIIQANRALLEDSDRIAALPGRDALDEDEEILGTRDIHPDGHTFTDPETDPEPQPDTQPHHNLSDAFKHLYNPDN